MLQLAQYRLVGIPRRCDKFLVGQISDADKTDVSVFAVEGTPEQRFVDILEPMGTNKIRVVGNGA